MLPLPAHRRQRDLRRMSTKKSAQWILTMFFHSLHFADSWRMGAEWRSVSEHWRPSKELWVQISRALWFESAATSAVISLIPECSPYSVPYSSVWSGIFNSCSTCSQSSTYVRFRWHFCLLLPIPATLSLSKCLRGCYVISGICRYHTENRSEQKKQIREANTFLSEGLLSSPCMLWEHPGAQGNENSIEFSFFIPSKFQLATFLFKTRKERIHWITMEGTWIAV